MISQLLKLASEDKVCEEKLAFVYDAMEDKDVGQEVTDEVESLLADVEDALEKSAGAKSILSHPAVGLGTGLIGGGAIGYGIKKKLDDSTLRKKDKTIHALGALNHALMGKDQLAKIDFKNTKQAGLFDSLKGGASAIGNAAKGAASAAKPYAGAAALGAAGIVGSALVNDLYSAARLAVTRNRNYKSMLEADPELKQHPAEKVKALFNTLHEKGGPEMSGDPLIASAFVKQQLELPPQFLLEQVHKLVGTGAALSKSRQMGSFDMGRIMGAGGGKQMASEAGKQIGKQMLSSPSGPRGIGGETCPTCGSNDVTVSNKGGLIFSDCEDCHHTW